MTDTLQHDLGAEQAVLGAMMASEKAIVDAEPILGDGDGFYRPAHTLIYRTILELRDAGSPTDPIAVTAHLTSTGNIRKVGGVEYLHTCYAAAPPVPNVTHYAGIIASYATLRALSRYADNLRQMTLTAGYSGATELLEKARQMLADLDGGRGRRDTLRLWRDTTPGLLEEIERAERADIGLAGIPTGLHDLDDLLGGLRPGQLALVGARPGIGKSVMLINIAMHAAMRHKLRTALFSLEMSETEIGMRILSAGTAVPLQAIRSGKLDDIQWAKITRYVADTEDAPLHIDETPRATLAHIRSAVKRLVAEHGGIDLILVDYLQLTETSGREPRQEQVAALSRGLKLLAKEVGVPVVAASQLNRDSESRSDKRPQLSDLRESGALEQDADIVILLHREDAHDHESPRAGECDVIVAKNRHGPMDTVSVASQLHICRFTSMAVDL